MSDTTSTYATVSLEELLTNLVPSDLKKGRPYVISCSEKLEKRLESNRIFKGITGTAGGFYGPQGRVLRAPLSQDQLINQLTTFKHQEHFVSNFEMETSALYGLGKLLNHQCLTACVIIANRVRKEFTSNYAKSVEILIQESLQRLTS